MRTAILIALLPAVVGGCTPASPARTPAGAYGEQVTEYRLDNGLRTILVEDRSQPLVAVALAYDVGAGNEAPATYGYSHILEHLAFQGTEHITKAQFDTVVSARGGASDGTTGWDVTTYDSVAPASELRTLLWMESDRMGFLAAALNEERLTNQRDVVLQEFSLDYDSSAYGRAKLALERALFPSPHPYHGAVIGLRSTIESAGVEDIRAFIDRYYAPENATLVVVGNFERSEAIRAVECYFGPLPSRMPRTEGASLPATPPSGTRRVLVNDVATPRISFAWTVQPSPNVDARMKILSYAIGQGVSNPLSRSLVDEANIATRAVCWYDKRRLASVFRCDITARAGVDANQLSLASLDAIRNIALTEDRVSSAVARWRLAFAHVVEGIRERAQTIAYHAAMNEGGYATVATYVALHEQQRLADMSEGINLLRTSEPTVLIQVPEGTK